MKLRYLVLLVLGLTACGEKKQTQAEKDYNSGSFGIQPSTVVTADSKGEASGSTYAFKLYTIDSDDSAVCTNYKFKLKQNLSSVGFKEGECPKTGDGGAAKVLTCSTVHNASLKNTVTHILYASGKDKSGAATSYDKTSAQAYCDAFIADVTAP